MKARHSTRASGMSLIEAVAAIGLLAMTLPLVMMALGRCASLTRQTRFHGAAQWLLPMDAGRIRAAIVTRPDADLWWVGVHAADGALLGNADPAMYRDGVAIMGGREARQLVVVERCVAREADEDCQQVRISIEEPACRPVAVRRRLSFHTRMRPP